MTRFTVARGRLLCKVGLTPFRLSGAVSFEVTHSGRVTRGIVPATRACACAWGRGRGEDITGPAQAAQDKDRQRETEMPGASSTNKNKSS